MSFIFLFSILFLAQYSVSAEQPDLNAGSPERQNAGAHHGYVFCFNTVITLLNYLLSRSPHTPERTSKARESMIIACVSYR